MKTRTMLMIGATTLGLALTGATAASAATIDDTAARTMAGAGFHGGDGDWTGGGMTADEDWAGGYQAGDGLGDPADCPYLEDADADRDQVRDRLRDADGDGTPDRTYDRVQQRLHDCVNLAV
ncbi:hypothetical protein OEB99_05670 [Actinotalea sp. M2MS4P-6]|uniref:hypothetical protein n=1 Tax=Actinotalea sp. M2MS4P-6 TaxID=2983762 RepID=UPI0021E49DF0|nr:hypothetical protein [Actinotalea sp. M2MS4P-6]MCV2393791.1 hypothetical protein [Actinotalea sp. M2MS4P-6]